MPKKKSKFRRGVSVAPKLPVKIVEQKRNAPNFSRSKRLTTSKSLDDVSLLLIVIILFKSFILTF